jgi:hypothetical protein
MMLLQHFTLESDLVGSIRERQRSADLPPRSCLSLSNTVLRGSSLFAFLIPARLRSLPSSVVDPDQVGPLLA